MISIRPVLIIIGTEDRLQVMILNKPAMWVSIPNPWGFYDMQGNVWEWVHDWKANYLPVPKPILRSSGSSRGLRGGSWHRRRGDCVLLSNLNAPSYRNHNLGFRVGFQAMPADTANPN